MNLRLTNHELLSLMAMFITESSAFALMGLGNKDCERGTTIIWTTKHPERKVSGCRSHAHLTQGWENQSVPEVHSNGPIDSGQSKQRILHGLVRGGLTLVNPQTVIHLVDFLELLDLLVSGVHGPFALDTRSVESTGGPQVLQLGQNHTTGQSGVNKHGSDVD